MYSPTARLLTVLELLQSHGEMSGPELARRLEIDVRTVRRYILRLQDMGLPIESERGPYGAYRLRSGYRVPPLMFTDGEAVALTLGLLAMREFRFPVEVVAVEGALAKAERVMPTPLLQQVRSLQDAISFHVSMPPIVLEPDVVVTLSLAVKQRQGVSLRYRSGGGEETERELDPYGIVFNNGTWYASGYCHLRQDVRTFRLDRIVRAELRERTFERPDAFDVVGQVVDSLPLVPGATEVEVVLETSLEQARQMIGPIRGTLEPSTQGVIFRRTTSQLEWVAHMLLSLPVPARVIKPPELRTLLQAMSERAAQLAVDSEPGDIRQT
jgi:predicted DNA-binding transcriptional regulator YafY